ncbi:unnamed protein product [Symbiodinium natans]|uniref:EF-hand domain-containing protein n=1 Tax=Symbiodinium natans TaxID=878477 RepID=A0A812LEU9_9DINO|nr:unnamed protein product [Symbiodinium natans]
MASTGRQQTRQHRGKFDVNNDGFITLGDLRKFFESSSKERCGLEFSKVRVLDDELQLLAEALHGAQAATPPRPPPSMPSPPAPPEPSAADKAWVSVSVLGVVGRFRLYGLRSLEPEELFWASFQALLFRLPDQPDAQQVLRSSFLRLRNAQGDIAAADVLSVLASYEVPANQLPLRSLRRVLQWLGVEARSLEEVLPAAQLPGPGDAQEPEFRLRLQKLRIVYQDFAQRLEKGLGRAQLQLRPPEALAVPAPPSHPVDFEARCHAAQARESAANRRCVVLEQEVRTKDRIAKELQRQVGELDSLVERLESELYEERGSKVNLMAQLNASVPKAEVDPKLRQLEELKFQVEQSSLALKQSKDLARVCAAQAESYEQLVKRRQQEVRHLQESVKMLQAGDEVANTVGKLQYRLLLSQWEKGNIQRQLQTATQDLRQARRELLENEEQVEQERHEHDQTEELLRQRLTEASTQAAQLAEQSAAAMPVDKARQLTSRLEEISSRKMELEERLSNVRLELLRNQAETDSCRLRAQQAQELLVELKALDPDSEAPRQRLLDMAKKLADSKLQELQHKRSLEIVKEQHQQLEKARQADEKEIQNLQREVANAESKLADQEQQWRAKVLEAQGAAPATAAIRRTGQISIEALEEIQGKVSERDARIAVLESDLQRAKADQESAVAEERGKVRKLELELGLVAEGDTAKLRQALRAEHDSEVAQISQAAQESVQTLQQLLDQTEEHLQRQQQETGRLHQSLSEHRAKHTEETMQLQQEIAGLRQELLQVRHHQQADVGASARLSPLPPPPLDESARLGDSIGSEAFGGMAGLGERLDEQREQVVSLHHRLEQQQEEFQSLLDQQHQEARRREEQLRGREERLHQEYQAREQRLLDLQEAQRHQRDQELLRIKEELASLQHSETSGANEAHQRLHEQVAEAQKHADLALQHNAMAEQNRLSAESWQRKAEEFEAELQKERQKHQDSTMRKQQASLRKQLAKKEEQLGSLRKAVEELKDRVVQLTIRNESEELESGNARRAESEVRKRITGQEEKVQTLKDQVVRLSKQLQEQKAQATHEAARAGELDSREAVLGQLLEAAAAQLAEKAAEARRFEEQLVRQTRRATEAEEALRGERGVAEGEVKIAKKEGQAAAEANARRVGALLERVEVLQAERLELSAKLHGAEASLALLRGASRSGAPVEAVASLAEAKERLRGEQHLRQALQEEVRDLSAQLEMMAGARVEQKTLSSPSPLQELTSQALGSPLHQGTSRSGSRSPASRSPVPRSLKQASELAARCGQLQAEVASLKARSSVLEQENDDLKLRVASDGDAMTASASAAEIDMLKGSLENVNAQNRALATEIEAERLRHRAVYRNQGEEELRRLQQQLNQAYQSLAAERQRIGVLSQALEVERHMRVAPNTSDSSSAVALATARATIADLQQRLDEALKARIQLPAASHPREAELAARVEELMRENTQLRRQVASPGRGASVEVPQLQARIQELLRENLALQQRAAGSISPLPPVPATPVAPLTSAPPVAAVPVAATAPSPDTVALTALQQQVAQLQARVQELLRENHDIQRRRSPSPPQSGDAGALAASRRQVEELQARLQDVLRENLELQRRSQSPIPAGDAAALAAARRQNEELQVKVQELLCETELLRRSQSPAPSGDAAALAGARRQNEELQGRVQELQRENQELQRRAADPASGALALAAARRQNEELQVRVQELLRENLELQRPQGPQGPPPPPGDNASALAAARGENEELQARVQELQRENLALQQQSQAPPPPVPDNFGAFDLVLGAAKRQNEELEARVQELVRENLHLQQRSPSPPGVSGEAALRRQNEELQARVQGVLRDNLELQRRSPSPPGAVLSEGDVLAAAQQKNEDLQVRCLDLIQENDALRQQLQERGLSPSPRRDLSPQRPSRRPAAEALRSALQQKELSLVQLLTDLDPQMHGKVSFEAFRLACNRHRLPLQAEDFAKLAGALNLDKRGFFAKEDLLRAFRSAEVVRSAPASSSAASRGRKAAEGPGTQGRGGSREAAPPSAVGAVEAKHRRQLEHLESRLFQSEEEKRGLQQELEALRREDTAREEALQKPRALSVLLSAGDAAPPIIKELKLEVKGTRELRDKLYNAEMQLESYKRRLEVDARQELEKERHVVKQLQAELEEKERTVAELIFDLRRARNASSEGDWAQREEEYMRLDLQLRKLEGELASSRRAERDMADRLLQAEHVAMELRFDREQVHLRSSRLESRILELELLTGGDSPRQRHSPLKTGAGAAAANLQSRKERNLENVIEGLERVVNQQKAENQRLKVALDRRPDERRGRGRAEVERLRKRVEELESALPRRQDSHQPPEGPALEAYRRELAAKEEVILKLQERLREGPSAEPPEMKRLLQELSELRQARSEDGQALDEAQRALQEAEMTEKRYLEVVRENRKLRQDLSALEDDGFWKEIESLQARNQEAVSLAKESHEVLLRCGAHAGVDISSLAARLETFAAAG